MKRAFAAAALLLAACQTNPNADLVRAGYTDAAEPLPLAEAPNCPADTTPGRSLVNAWCGVVGVADVAGRAPACTGLTGEAGSKCRLDEIRSYVLP